MIILQIQFPVSEITCVVCCSEPGNPRIAVYTPKLNRSKILRLQFASDTEMEDWLAHLTSGKERDDAATACTYKSYYFFLSDLPDE